MKFGVVPLAQAEGAILAHSQPLPDGRLRKGVTLTSEHLEAMAEAGLAEVVAAQLEEGDVHENAAALSVAEAAIDGAAHLRLSTAFTGRVNLIAEQPGVVLLDAERIIAANEVDPMITVATVPDKRQMHPGGMVATIKIISYAVPEAALRQVAAHMAGAVRFATPIYKSASLLLSQVPGGPPPKAQDAIETRLNGLGMHLVEQLTCRHDEAALAAQLRASRGDLVLMLTASATSDLRDTGPEALRLAGGQVTRFGIPVDPGNLLFLGQLGERPVIGLPGSARSPVLHGADWVLARVACGLTISPRDFAAMGVGGLLKEIPTRPQPRSGRTANKKEE